MLTNSLWQARAFGPTASTIVLATKGGAVLGGIWISAKGTAPLFNAFDTASTTPTLNKIVGSTVPAAVGINNFLGICCGTGLVVKTASCSGSILWTPSSAGV